MGSIYQNQFDQPPPPRADGGPVFADIQAGGNAPPTAGPPTLYPRSNAALVQELLAIRSGEQDRTGVWAEALGIAWPNCQQRSRLVITPQNAPGDLLKVSEEGISFNVAAFETADHCLRLVTMELQQQQQKEEGVDASEDVASEEQVWIMRCVEFQAPGVVTRAWRSTIRVGASTTHVTDYLGSAGVRIPTDPAHPFFRKLVEVSLPHLVEGPATPPGMVGSPANSISQAVTGDWILN